MTRILIADDHVIVREGLKKILGADAEMDVCGEAGSGLETLQKLQQGHWDIVVLDISLPDRNGLDILKQIKSQRPELPVLMLTMHAEEQYAVRALAAGAGGYLTKESAPEELITAVRKVAGGGRYVSPALAERLAFGLGAGEPQRPLHESLSDREFQVLQLLASGKSIGEIATMLVLSVKTISTYRTRILEKLRVGNNAELIIYAIKNQLVQ